jgi:hypothetical protein
MTAYHLRFRHLDRRIVTATQSLLDARTSRLPAARAQAEFQRWLDLAAEIYGVPSVHLRIVPPEQCHRFGRYVAPDAILMPRYSIVTLLHEFRLHLQAQGRPLIADTDNPRHDDEDDARAWSLSLYHAARPEQLARLVREGKILHLTAADMTAPAA